MKRIILMVVTNLFFVIVCWPKLCRMAAHPERYTKEERWKHLQSVPAVLHSDPDG